MSNKIAQCYLCIGIMSQLNMQESESFRLKLQKIQCNILDKSVLTFESCRVKAVSRDLQFAQLDVHFSELPLRQFKGDFRFLKKANGYKPFLYNFTATCSFIKHLNSITNIMWTWFKDNTNMNHTCPIDTDFHMPRLENIYLQNALQMLPVPLGEYALFTHWMLNNKTAADVNFFALLY